MEFDIVELWNTAAVEFGVAVSSTRSKRTSWNCWELLEPHDWIRRCVKIWMMSNKVWDSSATILDGMTEPGRSLQIELRADTLW